MNNDQNPLGTATTSVLITEMDIRRLVSLSGDMNPIHSDENYSKKSIFKVHIAPGLMVASDISAVVANDLPGPGSIYLDQNLRFEAPDYIGDTVTTTVRVIERTRTDRLILETTCRNQSGQCVVSGTALVKIPIDS